MSNRKSSARATRGVSKAKKHGDSSSSNPKTVKFRMQHSASNKVTKNKLDKKNKSSKKTKQANDGVDYKKILNSLNTVDLIEKNLDVKSQDVEMNEDRKSQLSHGTNLTTASFASVWSNCSNASLNEFFQVWNPKLTSHKDALSVIAGLTQIMTKKGSDQTDLEVTEKLFKLIASEKCSVDIITGSLVALSFVFRRLDKDTIVKNFNEYYAILKCLMDKYENCKKKSLLKSLVKCFIVISKAHPTGKESIEPKIRKKINIAIRQCKAQSKLRL